MVKVFVTGGAGFIGSALLRELLADNHEVVCYDSLVGGRREYVPKEATFIKGDILSWKIYESILTTKPDVVFHLAAEPFVPYSYENPERFFEVNVRGTMNVLTASKVASVAKVVHWSTSEVYGTAQYVPMDEKHPTEPHSTYGVSKMMADRLADSFYHEHQIPVVIVRPFNCYGPRETQAYVIPEIIRQLSKSDGLLLGNIKASRDFTYVHDCAKAAIAIMKTGYKSAEVINICSNNSYSIQSLIDTIASLMGKENHLIDLDKTKLRPNDVDVLYGDNIKLKELTWWEPTTSIEDGLKQTIEWYRENGQRWSWEV